MNLTNLSAEPLGKLYSWAPPSLQDASLRTEEPYAYRDLDECLLLLDGYVEEIMRFQVKAYRGHLLGDDCFVP